MNFNVIFALLVLPAAAVLISLALNRLAGNDKSKPQDKSKSAGAFQIALAGTCSIPGVMFLTVFMALAHSCGLSLAIPGFGYLIALIISFAIAIVNHGNKENRGVSSSPFLFPEIIQSKLASLMFLLPVLAVLAFNVAYQMRNIHVPILMWVPMGGIILLVPLWIALFFGGRRLRNYIQVLSLSFCVIVSIAAIIRILFHQGGLHGLIDLASRENPQLLVLNNPDMIFITGGIFLGLSIFGQPQFISVISNARCKKDIATGGIIAVCLTTIIIWSVIYYGSFDLTQYIESAMGPICVKMDSLGPYLMVAHMAMGVSLVAALLVYMNGLLLKMAALISNRFITTGFIGCFGSILVFVMIWIIYYIGLYSEHDPLFPLALAGCAFGPAFLMRSAKKVSAPALLCGIYSGLFFTIAWHIFRTQGYRPWGYPMIHEIIPGFIFSLLVIAIVNRRR
jgi:hypothetical protein